jgi:signal transduction histidine kinase
MEDKQHNKYEILRGLAVSGARGQSLQSTGEMALRQAADLVGLKAAAMYLWDENMDVKLAVTHADSDSSRDRLASLEDNLFASLRRERKLISAYMSFDDDPPVHSFTHPLRHGKSIFGAVIGIQEGERTLVAEDVFLEALSAAVALNVIADGMASGKGVDKDLLEKERLGAVVETAVTVNHEINNPLTAILGNVQLLLLKRDTLDEELQRKLETIEEAAMKIRDVTQKLLNLTSARSVEYSEGASMLDLSDEEDPDTNQS